jgi:hypothetical protein
VNRPLPAPAPGPGPAPSAPDVTRRPRYPASGWIEAALFVFAIGFLSLAYTVGHRIGAHPIAFVLYAMLVSAGVLLAVTGPGPEARAIILAPQSWLIGIGAIAMEVFYFILLRHLPPADGSLLVRLTIPTALAVGWVFFGRRPQAVTLAGGAVICLGLAPMIAGLDAGKRAATLIAVGGCVVAFNLRTFSAEFHPWNRRARTVMEKLRITGLIVLVTAAAGLALAAGASLLIATGSIAPSRLVPTAAQMLHLPTILLGALVGSAILTAMAFLSFSCVVKITSENFAAATAFTPVATLLVQWAAGALGLIAPFPVDAGLVPAMGVVIAGMFLMLWGARRR